MTYKIYQNILKMIHVGQKEKKTQVEFLFCITNKQSQFITSNHKLTSHTSIRLKIPKNQTTFRGFG